MAVTGQPVRRNAPAFSAARAYAVTMAVVSEM
jgi:hypothetical protein